MSDEAIAGFELWDMKSRNLLDDFDTEAEALEAVRKLIALNGPETTDFMVLTCVRAGGCMTTIAGGDEVAARARAIAEGLPRRARG